MHLYVVTYDHPQGSLVPRPQLAYMRRGLGLGMRLPQCDNALNQFQYLDSYLSGPYVVWKESMVILYMFCSDV